MTGETEQKKDRSPFRTQTWVLICVNSTCRLMLPIGYHRYALDKCPRCGSPMRCEVVRG